MRESSLWNAIRKAGLFDWAERIESHCTPGLPDVHGIIDGREVWVELKVCPNWLEPAQVIWHRRWSQMGMRNGFILLGGYEGVVELHPSSHASPRLRDIPPAGIKVYRPSPEWVPQLRCHICKTLDS